MPNSHQRRAGAKGQRQQTQAKSVARAHWRHRHAIPVFSNGRAIAPSDISIARDFLKMPSMLQTLSESSCAV